MLKTLQAEKTLSDFAKKSDLEKGFGGVSFTGVIVDMNYTQKHKLGDKLTTSFKIVDPSFNYKC